MRAMVPLLLLLLLLPAGAGAEVRQMLLRGYSAFYSGDKLLFDAEAPRNGALRPVSDRRIPDGTVKVYARDKFGTLLLIYEYTSKKGAANGPAKSYTKYGSVESKFSYRNGMLDGKRTEYYPDGKPRAASMWRQDSLKWREEFDEEGNVTDSYVMVDGARVQARLVHGSELTNPVWITKDGHMGKLDE